MISEPTDFLSKVVPPSPRDAVQPASQVDTDSNVSSFEDVARGLRDDKHGHGKSAEAADGKFKQEEAKSASSDEADEAQAAEATSEQETEQVEAEGTNAADGEQEDNVEKAETAKTAETAETAETDEKAEVDSEPEVGKTAEQADLEADMMAALTQDALEVLAQVEASLKEKPAQAAEFLEQAGERLAELKTEHTGKALEKLTELIEVFKSENPDTSALKGLETAVAQLKAKLTSGETVEVSEDVADQLVEQLPKQSEGALGEIAQRVRDIVRELKEGADDLQGWEVTTRSNVEDKKPDWAALGQRLGAVNGNRQQDKAAPLGQRLREALRASGGRSDAGKVAQAAVSSRRSERPKAQATSDNASEVVTGLRGEALSMGNRATGVEQTQGTNTVGRIEAIDFVRSIQENIRSTERVSLQQGVDLVCRSEHIGTVGVSLRQDGGTLNVMVNVPDSALQSKLFAQRQEIEGALKKLNFDDVSLNFTADNPENKQTQDQPKGNAEEDNVQLSSEGAEDDIAAAQVSL